MNGKTILYFVKFFQEERFADQFLKGSLYLNRLSYFKKIESADDDGRPDTNEAVAMWWQPDDLIIELRVPGFDDVKITKADLAGPVSMAFEHHNHLHVLCLHAMQISSFDTLDNQVPLAEHEAEMQRQLRIDERCFKFGPYAVVVQAVPFLAQLKEAFQRSPKKATGALVQYYDDATFHGNFDPKDIPFRKQERFSYQQEFRICVRTDTEGDDPLTIEMGSIGHFSAKVDSSRLNDQFKIQLSLSPTPSDGSAAGAGEPS